MGKFTELQLRQRACERIEWVLRHIYEEGNEPHTRLLDLLIEHRLAYYGSTGVGARREHVVPCAYICARAKEMFLAGNTRAEVAAMIHHLLWVVHVTPEEAKTVDAEHRQTMPDDWNYEAGGDILERLNRHNIPVMKGSYPAAS